MVNARNSHGNAYGVFISPEGWRILAGDNTPGICSISLHPGGVPESTAGYFISPIRRIRPIPSHLESILAHPKSTVDSGFERLIEVENGLRQASYKPIIRPKNKAIKPNTNRHRPKNFLPVAAMVAASKDCGARTSREGLPFPHLKLAFLCGKPSFRRK